jgi:hypothetical protein
LELTREKDLVGKHFSEDPEKLFNTLIDAVITNAKDNMATIKGYKANMIPDSAGENDEPMKFKEDTNVDNKNIFDIIMELDNHI